MTKLKKQLPTSDQRRVSALKFVKSRADLAPASVKKIIDDLPYDLDNLLEEFEKATLLVDDMEDESNKHVTSKNVAKMKAYLYIHDYLFAFIKAVDRGEYERNHLKLLKLPVSGPSASIGRNDKNVIDWVHTIKKGFETMSKKGLEPLDRPKESVVLLYCKEFIEAYDALMTAKKQLREARKPMKPLRNDITAFLKNIADEISHLARNNTKAQIREELREWGMEFSFDSKGDAAIAASNNVDPQDAQPPTGLDEFNSEVDDDDIGIDEEGVS